MDSFYLFLSLHDFLILGKNHPLSFIKKGGEMKTKRASHYTCHVLSQITRKSDYLHLSFNGPEENNHIEDWDFASWYSFCEELLGKNLTSHNPLGVQKLAEATYYSIQLALENHCYPILLEDQNYPELLKQTLDRPLCLFAQGNQKLLQNKLVAIIGSRKASPEALHQSYELARYLASEEVTVVSGGAYGCDILSHKGALKAGDQGASTIVVFAGGLKSLYPRGNKHTYLKIKEQGGLLISERLWHQDSRSYDFPIRNRIISGLCQSLLVMDAMEKSGSMITAQKALDQGRNVFVLKPTSSNLISLGIESLLLDGAESFSNSKDISKLISQGQI